MSIGTPDDMSTDLNVPEVPRTIAQGKVNVVRSEVARSKVSRHAGMFRCVAPTYLDVANFPRGWTLSTAQQKTFQNIEMSFQTLSERLTALQESNAQLKELIERLATIKFQPGSIPLYNEEGNVITELTSEIQQTLKDQDEDFELLQEDVCDLDSGRQGSELEQQKDRLDQAVKRAIKELKG
jgi:hypothetical protein